MRSLLLLLIQRMTQSGTLRAQLLWLLFSGWLNTASSTGSLGARLAQHIQSYALIDVATPVSPDLLDSEADTRGAALTLTDKVGELKR